MPGDLPDLHDRKAFARELTALRERAGLTIREVAARIDVPAATLGGYFGGRHLPPLRQPSVLAAILEACGVSDAPTREHWHRALRALRRLPGRRPADAPVPYRGLASFGSADADWFHGRDELIASLLAAFRTPDTVPLMVVGPSGSGKSSLLCAGLIPAARDGSCEFTVVTPGRRPLATLDRVGGGADGRALIVDQLEEIFTHGADEAQRSSFVDALGAMSGTVVLGMRSDFYDHALRYPLLAAALQRRQVIVGPMSEPELRRAIVEPARRARVELEDGLVELLLRDAHAAQDAGALPLLSHALLSTWERGGRHTLRIGDYRATGGIQGAVAATAEEVYRGLSEQQRQFTRRALLRLVHIDGTLVTRRRAARAELPMGGDDDQLALDRFVAGRLLTADGDQVEITHEALLTAWPRLRDWIDADRVGLRVHRQLTTAAAAWIEAGRDNHALLRGVRLALAGEWAADHDEDLNVREREFLDMSVAYEQAELRAARRRGRRLARLLAAATALFLVATGLAAYAYVKRAEANTQRDLAISRELAITADRLRSTDVALAAQLSLAAYRIAPTTQARSSLLMSYAGPAATRIVGPPGVVQSAAVSPDGHVAAMGAPDDTVRLWSLGPAQPLGRPLTGHVGTIFTVAFRPDGRLLATAGTDRAIRLWRVDPAGAALAGQVTAATNTIYSVAFSPDGTLLAAGSADGTVTLWKIADGGPPAFVSTAASSAKPVQTVAISPDGRTLAASGVDSTVRLFDISRPEAPVARPVALTGTPQTVFSVVFSRDGQLLAAGAGDGTVRLWNVGDPNHPTTHGPPLTGPTGWVNSVAFSPDGRLVAGGSSDQKVWLWRADTGRSVGTLPHPAQVTDVLFGPDDATISTAAADGVLRRWSVPGPVITGPTRSVFNAIPAGADHTLVVAAGDSTFSLWDTTNPRMPRSLGPVLTEPGGDGAATISPDARTLAVGTGSGPVRLWDITDPGHPAAQPARLTGHHATIEAVMFSPDSRLLVVAGDDHIATLWHVTDPAHPRRAGPAMGASNYVYSPVFSPNGHLLAYGTADNTFHLWDVRDPDRPVSLGPPLAGATSPVFAVAFSPDGKTLATAGSAIRLWDVTDPRHPTALAAPLTGPDRTLWSLAFSPDGRTLAAGTGDGTIWLWNMADAHRPTLRATVHAHDGPVFTVAFDPLNGILASGGADRTTRLWNIDTGQVAAFVCATAGTPVSAAEWARYVPGKAFRPPCRSTQKADG
jgi:WD40 repeat protein/transcriptional regulator with XRE-family HTH domain